MARTHRGKVSRDKSVHDRTIGQLCEQLLFGHGSPPREEEVGALDVDKPVVLVSLVSLVKGVIKVALEVLDLAQSYFSNN